MKTFEERYQAWLEGRLSPQEAAAFERELPPVSEADFAAQEAEWAPLRAALRGDEPNLTGGDFFNYQLMEKIQAEERGSRPSVAAVESRPGFSLGWFWNNMAWGGVCALLAAAVVYLAMTRPGGPASAGNSSALLAENKQPAPASTSASEVLPVHLRSGETAPKVVAVAPQRDPGNSGKFLGAAENSVPASGTTGTRAAVLTTFTVDPRISAKKVEADNDGVAVVLDGLETLPASFTLE